MEAAMPRYNGGNTKVPMIEKIISSVLGVDAEFEPHYDRLKIPTDNRVQSRIDKNNAPVSMVLRYANQMGEFDFPPIIVTKDAVTVDGNTRVKAHAKRGDRYIPALVIPIAWEDADDATRRKLLYISELINNMNGLPLDDSERRKMAYTMIEEGAPDEDIVGKVGLTLANVRGLREKYKASQRLRLVGIVPEGPINEVLRAFGKPNPQALDDTTFRDVAQLAVDAGLKSGEISSLATSLVQTGSPELRQERLVRERQSREAQIVARRTGQDNPQLASQLRKKLQVLFEHPLTVFLEHDPEKIQEHVDILTKAEEVLGDIRAAQANVPTTPAQPRTGARQ
jgi:ParB-like chromosome segregation protein Spo0J